MTISLEGRSIDQADKTDILELESKIQSFKSGQEDEERKSPTFAKRFRQYLEASLPEETNSLLDNLRILRDSMQDNFAFKVKELNRITESLIN